ncbi:hypothetical protein DFH27DRAFT_598603 [Peziza echinospora]|nr:hypothetical protein DFH27DRAFT_598603 [Peziza echinospora]
MMHCVNEYHGRFHGYSTRSLKYRPGVYRLNEPQYLPLDLITNHTYFSSLQFTKFETLTTNKSCNYPDPSHIGAGVSPENRYSGPIVVTISFIRASPITYTLQYLLDIPNIWIQVAEHPSTHSHGRGIRIFLRLGQPTLDPTRPVIPNKERWKEMELEIAVHRIASVRARHHIIDAPNFPSMDIRQRKGHDNGTEKHGIGCVGRDTSYQVPGHWDPD